MQQDGSEIEIDSRPSDAIALAIRSDAPIYAAESVIEESAIEFEGDEVNEEEIVDEFKRFLDSVSPDQFAVEDEEQDFKAPQLALDQGEHAGDELPAALLRQRATFARTRPSEQAAARDPGRVKPPRRSIPCAS